MSEEDDLEQRLSQNPELAALFAAQELHNGKLDRLVEHIRRSNFHIHPGVAAKILELIEGTNDNCLFSLTIIRRKDLPPARKDPRLTQMRNFEMACEVARLGGFKRANLDRACDEVAKKYDLTGLVVRRCVRPFRAAALAVVEEHQLSTEYAKGERDFLGRPICSQTGFDEKDIDA